MKMVAVIRGLCAASAIPAAVVIAAVAGLPSSPSPSSPSSRLRLPIHPSLCLSHNFAAVATSVPPHPALAMDSVATSDQAPAPLPELVTEFMVEMKCEGCVSAVKSNLLKLDGIKNVDVDLSNQVVRIISSLPVRAMVDALENTGRKARLIGQGSLHGYSSKTDFIISAAVAEFKGPVIYGVMRFAQANMKLARIDASFSGLSPGKHGWSINEFGDLTNGAASTGKVFDPSGEASEKPLGDLGTIEVPEDGGEAHFSGAVETIRVADLIGRSVAVYETEDRSDSGIAAAVIARSAGVGENYKKICTCDGVTIWESS